MLHHAGELDDLAQLHFAPAAAHARRAQRADEVLRFVLQLLLGLPDEAQQVRMLALSSTRDFSTSCSLASTWRGCL